MLAEDLRPNRLVRARYRLSDLLASTEEGQVGMVSYAGDAYVVSPLTSDMNTIANLLPALQPDIIPVGGSRADRALDLAAALLERSGLGRGEVLLVTDSASSRDAARARELREKGVLTSVLAVGTTDGAPVPSGGGFVSDRSGNVVIARMNRDALRAVAEAGAGRYTELATEAAPDLLWAQQDGSEFALRDDALGERWKDAGPWLVLLLIPLAAVGFRKGLFFVLPLVLFNGMALPRDAHAGWWEDMWQRRDQQAFDALAGDDPSRAASLAVNPDLLGDAWYRAGEYANADRTFNQCHLSRFPINIDVVERKRLFTLQANIRRLNCDWFAWQNSRRIAKRIFWRFEGCRHHENKWEKHYKGEQHQYGVNGRVLD